MEKDLSYFMEHPEEFDQLSDEDRMSLHIGESIEGEITGGSPAASIEASAEEGATDKTQTAAEEAPVVVAKDGKHTIPFEELQRARDEAKYWQAQAEEASRIAQQSQSEQPHNPTAAVDLKQLRRELREAMLLDDDARIDELEAQIDEEISRKAEAKAIQVLEQQAAQAEERAISATAESLIKTYPDLDHTKPGANLEAIATVQALSAMYVNRGSTRAQALVDAVDRVAKLYGMGEKAKADLPDEAAMEKAEKVIAQASAKAKVPSSLSSIPAAATPPADELQALSSMSVQQAQDKLMSMPREKILAVLSRQM